MSKQLDSGKCPDLEIVGKHNNKSRKQSEILSMLLNQCLVSRNGSAEINYPEAETVQHGGLYI